MQASAQKKSSHRGSFSGFLLHLHPAKINSETLRFNLSFGLGGMALTLCLLLFLTGFLLLFTYEPTTLAAYTSVRALAVEAGFGNWVRNIHHWSANIVVVVAFLHLLRVYFTGAINIGRRLNWVLGVMLLLLILLSNLTGYLLPWDQLAFWAITICTSMLSYVPLVGANLQMLLGGAEVGASTLSTFFVLHVVFLPVTLIILAVWHFWLVRKAGGLIQVEGETASPPIRVSTSPHLVVREAAVGFSLVAIVLLLAIFVNAPLLDHANPGLSPNPAKAPWYFLGFQELLMHFHPTFAVCVIPLLLLFTLLSLPFLRDCSLPAGRWIGVAKGRVITFLAVVCGFLLTSIGVFADDLILTSAGGAVTFDWFYRGLLPTILSVAGLFSVIMLLRKVFSLNRVQSVLILFTFIIAVMLALTVVGIWFRGEGMQLVWYW